MVQKPDHYELLDYRQSHTQIETAAHYGVTERTIRNWERVAEAAIHLNEHGHVTIDALAAKEAPDKSAAIAFPANADHECLVGRMTVNSDNCIVFGDAEIPDHSIEMLENIVKMARHFCVEDCLINGDFLSCDSCSPWPKMAIDFPSFRQELSAAKIVIRVLLQTFKRIWYNSGNHEWRLARKFDGQLSIGDFLGDIDGLTFSEYRSCILKSGGRQAWITHQKNYSKIPLSVPRELARTIHMDILCAHNHHLAKGYDASGNYWLAEGGYVRDSKRTIYKEMNNTTHPAWNAGFIFIRNGLPYMIDHNNIDFWLSVKSVG
jgi:hypothetical protein